MSAAEAICIINFIENLECLQMSNTCTVEPRYNEVLGTMKITLLYSGTSL